MGFQKATGFPPVAITAKSSSVRLCGRDAFTIAQKPRKAELATTFIFGELLGITAHLVDSKNVFLLE